MLLLVVLGLALLVAGIAQQLQVSAAVGAFLVGIAVSGDVAEGATALLLAPLGDLFAAVFFVFFGLSTARSRRASPNALPSVSPRGPGYRPQDGEPAPDMPESVHEAGHTAVAVAAGA